ALLVNALVGSAGRGVTRAVALLAALAVALSVLPELLFALKGYLDRKMYLSMHEYFELKFIERKARLDIARYEDPKFQDLLTKAEEQSIWPMLNLLQHQFYNIQTVLGLATASVVLAMYDWRMFLLVFAAAVPRFLLEAKYGYGVWTIYDAH